MTSLIIKAAQFADVKHHGQLRKWTGRPYIEHPLRVAGRACLIRFVPEHVIAAAWLHDVMEDCGIEYVELWDRFGARTADLVQELTNPSKALPHLSRGERKQIDREHLARVSDFAKLLKLLDRADNLREGGAADRQWRALYANESKLLAEALRDTTVDENVQLVAEVLSLSDQLYQPALAA